MKAIISLIFIFCSLLLNGQNDRGSANINDGYKATRGGVKGHPFFLDQWVIGYGIQADSSLTQPELFNYDIYQNNLTYRTGDGPNDIMVVTNDKLIGFVLKENSKQNLTFLKIKNTHFDKNKDASRYYWVLDPETKYVIVEPIKELDDPNVTGWSASSTNTKAAKYDYKEKIYVLNGENKFVEVKLKKSSILNALKDKRNTVSNFITINNIALNSPEELIPILEHYHTR